VLSFSHSVIPFFFESFEFLKSLISKERSFTYELIVSFEKALSHLDKSKVLKNAFSKETINSYIKLKNKEIKKYKSSNVKKIGFKGSKQNSKNNVITQWEKDNTLDC